MHAAFDDEHLDKLFAALSSARGVLLAVSGGPDSVALMRLVATWAQRDWAQRDWAQRDGAHRPPVAVFVATVDHGLRPESRAEAEQVGVWARDLGLPHAILPWRGDKPTTRLQERARAARYDLLLRHARAVGADHLVTAHHADDQAETILFRLLRGSGLAGLAGMQAATRLEEVVHLRPFLALRKAALVDFCQACGQAFLSDPSNENPRFARARLRRLAPLLAEEGLDTENLLRLGRRAARADAALAESAARLRASLDACRDAGSIAADLRPCAGVPEEILLRLLEMEIADLCPGRPLRLGRLESLTTALAAALGSGAPLRATLAGTLLSLDGEGRLTIRREGPRRRGRRASGQGQSSDSQPPAGAATGRPEAAAATAEKSANIH